MKKKKHWYDRREFVFARDLVGRWDANEAFPDSVAGIVSRGVNTGSSTVTLACHYTSRRSNVDRRNGCVIYERRATIVARYVRIGIVSKLAWLWTLHLRLMSRPAITSKQGWPFGSILKHDANLPLMSCCLSKTPRCRSIPLFCVCHALKCAVSRHDNEPLDMTAISSYPGKFFQFTYRKYFTIMRARTGISTEGWIDNGTRKGYELSRMVHRRYFLSP